MVLRVFGVVGLAEACSIGWGLDSVLGGVTGVAEILSLTVLAANHVA